jgi:hypothetical protein
MAISNELREALVRQHSRRKIVATATVASRAVATEEDRDDPLQDPDDRVDPDDLGPRLAVSLQPVARSYALPSSEPLPAEMPSSWWTPLLFGEPGDAISPKDARACLALIEMRLSEGQDSGPLIKTRLAPNGEGATGMPETTGALHEQIYQLYGERGWFAFQRLYHEAAGLHPKRHKTVEATNVIPNNDAASLCCDAIEPGLASAIMQAPTRVMRWMLAPPRDPPPWRSNGPPPGADDGSWCG